MVILYGGLTGSTLSGRMPVKRKLVPVVPLERTGYEIPSPVGSRANYAGGLANVTVDHEPWWRKTRTEQLIGLLIFAGGLYYTVKAETFIPTISSLSNVLLNRPAQIALLGLLIWLHAKWRRAVRVA